MCFLLTKTKINQIKSEAEYSANASCFFFGKEKGFDVEVKKEETKNRPPRDPGQQSTGFEWLRMVLFSATKLWITQYELQTCVGLFGPLVVLGPDVENQWGSSHTQIDVSKITQTIMLCLSVSLWY